MNDIREFPSSQDLVIDLNGEAQAKHFTTIQQWGKDNLPPECSTNASFTTRSIRRTVQTASKNFHPEETFLAVARGQNHLATTANKLYVTKSARQAAEDSSEISNVMANVVLCKEATTHALEWFPFKMNKVHKGFPKLERVERVIKDRTCHTTQVADFKLADKRYMQIKVVWMGLAKEWFVTELCKMKKNGASFKDINDIISRSIFKPESQSITKMIKSYAA